MHRDIARRGPPAGTVGSTQGAERRGARRRAAVAFAVGVAWALALGPAEPAAAGSEEEAASAALPDVELTRIDGSEDRLAAWRGQVLLIVNVASRCGFTPQYEGLEALYDRYRERGFAVLGFPSNDFAGQEPGSNAEIAQFCRGKYGVRFPMFEKLRVKGPDRHPLYAALTGLPGPLGGEVAWNFQKYLVDREGRVVAKFAPRVEPRDDQLTSRIEELLAQKG